MFVLIAFTRLSLKCVNTAGGEEPPGARTQLRSILSISYTSNKAIPECGLVLKPQRRLQSWLLKINQIPQTLDLLMKHILCASYQENSPGISLPLLYRPQLGFSPACSIPNANHAFAIVIPKDGHPQM